MKNIALLSVIVVTLYAGPGSAQLSGSNFSKNYPAHPCDDNVPIVPSRPDKFKTEAELSAYNVNVEEYNQVMEQLFECIQRYVNNAAADIERIHTLSKEAIGFVTNSTEWRQDTTPDSNRSEEN